MKHTLVDKEKLIADKAYRDAKFNQVSLKRELYYSKLLSIVLGRHKTCNRILKQFGILGARFWHSKNRHSIFFRAVVNET